MISVTDDPHSAGFAVIELDSDHPGDLRVSVRFLDGNFLGPDGRRTHKPHFFAADAGDDRRTFRLGPEVTAHVREAEIVALSEPDGTPLGTVDWEGIRAPPEWSGGAPIAIHNRELSDTEPPTVPKTTPLPDETDDTKPLDETGDGAQQDKVEQVLPDTTEAGSTGDSWRDPPPPWRRRAALAGLATALVFGTALLLVLAGLVGWRLEPTEIAISGPPGGPFRPAVEHVRFERAFYVKPFAWLLFGDAPPFALAAAPAWLKLAQSRTDPGSWALDVAASPETTRELEPGTYTYLVPLRFPLASFLGSARADGCAISLTLARPGHLVLAADHALDFEGPRGGPFAPATHRVSLSNVGGRETRWQVAAAPAWVVVSPSRGDLPRGRRVELTVAPSGTATELGATTADTIEVAGASASGVPVRIIIDQPPADARPSIDDVACDRLAGNRFDPDHPITRGYRDDIAELTPDDIARGLTVCDPSTERHGADRRYAVQRGRMLAERAQRNVARGDIAGARRDMDEAVAIWKAEAANGSAYAENFLGAYYKGSFNRPEALFVAPNDAEADAHWLMAMQRGSIVAERNYAAQLLSGYGMDRDPTRAVSLLEDALAKGDERAGGVLGVALYDGNPPGVPRDAARGWSLIVRAQCVDGEARRVLDHEIAKGRQSSADRHAC